MTDQLAHGPLRGFERKALESLKFVKYDPIRKALNIFSSQSQGYSIPLDHCNSNAGILNELCHMSSKCWVTAEALGELVIAFDVLLDPQSNLPHGRDKGGLTINAEHVAQYRYVIMMREW